MLQPRGEASRPYGKGGAGRIAFDIGQRVAEPGKNREPLSREVALALNTKPSHRIPDPGDGGHFSGPQWRRRGRLSLLACKHCGESDEHHRQRDQSHTASVSLPQSQRSIREWIKPQATIHSRNTTTAMKP